MEIKYHYDALGLSQTAQEKLHEIVATVEEELQSQELTKEAGVELKQAYFLDQYMVEGLLVSLIEMHVEPPFENEAQRRKIAEFIATTILEADGYFLRPIQFLFPLGDTG